MIKEDTIAAIATPVGNGGVAIIRVSGNQAFDIVNTIIDRDLTKLEPNYLTYGNIINNGEVIDEVMITKMVAPNSFTAEDVVEINCHGGVIITNQILNLCLSKGARLAEPGEFTKRAFLNGRIKLNEAEAVSDLIHAANESMAKHAISGLKGKLTTKVNELREELLNILADIEVNIDYPEYNDLPQVTESKLKRKLTDLNNQINELIENSKSSHIIENGIKTILIGKPNVGKSSILNELLGTDKAIVTDIPGTTRDTVEGKIMIEGLHLNLIDTAGLRDTDNLVEELGVKKSISLLEEADLILYVLNNNEALTKEDLDILNKYQDKIIIIINKTDLESKLDQKQLKDYASVKTSVINQTGFDELKSKIIELFNLNIIKEDQSIIYLNERQLQLIGEASIALTNAINGVGEVPVDLLAIDLKTTWEKLSAITGDIYEESLLDNLFSRFCLGK